jgi:ectoine hydroxylase-related dioxygenase (phytanoyl-CoA dioxygenase family)
MEAKVENGLVTQEHIDDFRENGVVVVKNALSSEWVETLRGALDDLMENPTKMGLEYAHKEDSTRFFGDQYMWLTKPDFRRIAFESPIGEIAGQVMGSESVTLFFDQVLVKEPGAVEPTPWHHDLPYWMVRGEQICTVWIALDPIGLENGGMKYVKGSHKSEKLYSPTFFGDTSNDSTFDETRYEPLPDVDATYSDDDFITFQLKPGDAAIHHARTFHGAPGNKSAETRRRGYMLRVLGDNVVYAPAPGQAKVAVRPDLPDGAPMGGEYFPEIWQRAGA